MKEEYTGGLNSVTLVAHPSNLYMYDASIMDNLPAERGTNTPVFYIFGLLPNGKVELQYSLAEALLMVTWLWLDGWAIFGPGKLID